MKYNQKGFTLVEILIVISLISLILGLGIPGIMKMRDSMNKRSLNTKIDLIESSALVWGNNNKTLLKNDKCNIDGSEYDCYKISVGNLIEDDYLTSEKNGEIVYNNPEDNTSLLSKCIYVYKKNNRVYSYYSKDDEECVYDSSVPSTTKNNTSSGITTTSTTKNNTSSGITTTSTTKKTTTQSSNTDPMPGFETCSDDGIQLKCDKSNYIQYTTEEIASGITCNILTQGTDNHIYEELDFLVLADDGEYITLIAKNPYPPEGYNFSIKRDVSSITHRGCYYKNNATNEYSKGYDYDEAYCNINITDDFTINSDNPYLIEIVEALHEKTKGWYMLEPLNYTEYVKFSYNSTDSYIKISQSNGYARLPIKSEIEIISDHFTNTFILNDFYYGQYGYKDLPFDHPGYWDPYYPTTGYSYDYGNYTNNTNGYGIYNWGYEPAYVNPIIKINREYYEVSCNVANGCCMYDEKYVELGGYYDCFCTNQP